MHIDTVYQMLSLPSAFFPHNWNHQKQNGFSDKTLCGKYLFQFLRDGAIAFCNFESESLLCAPYGEFVKELVSYVLSCDGFPRFIFFFFLYDETVEDNYENTRDKRSKKKREEKNNTPSEWISITTTMKTKT